MKYSITVLLAAISIIAGVAGTLSRVDHWHATIFLWSLCGVLAVFATIAGVYEGIPKPHIVPIGYGRLRGNFDGLLFRNDGEPAYQVIPPEPIKLGKVGAAQLVLDDPVIG